MAFTIVHSQVRALSFFFLSIFQILALGGSLFGQTDVFWIGGNGDWNNSANWTGNVVPNNGVNTYNVFVDGGAVGISTVNMNFSPTIDQLNVDVGESVHILDNHSLTLNTNSQINNNGLITVNSSGNATRIRVNQSSNPSGFFGTGRVALSGGAQITGSGRVTNGIGHTISGTGNVGLNAISFTNQGTIQAGPGESMTLDVVNLGSETVAFDNQGLVLATGGGTMTISGSGFGEFGGSGVYRAEADSRIDLVTEVIVHSSTFATVGNGEVRAASGSNQILDQVTNMGNFLRSDNGVTTLRGSMTNSGQISVQGAGNATRLRLQGNVLLNGGGNIVFSGANAGIDGSGLLTNANNTISGNGNLGHNAISVWNQGVVRAGSGENLLIDPVNLGTGMVSFDNQNSVVASGGGTVTLTGSGFGEFGGSGTYSAENGSRIDLVGEVIARNTTFSTTGSGTIWASSEHNQTLDGGTNTGMMIRDNNGVLRIANSLTNSGTILIQAAGNDTRLRTQGDVTLTGGGSVTLIGNNAGIDGSGTLTNINNTISGNGTLGLNAISVVNQGIVQAGENENLLLDPQNLGTGNISFNNQNIVRATSGGIVTLTGSGFGEFGGSGVYLAMEGSRIDLGVEAIARNTTFAASGTGMIRVTNGNNSTWDGVTTSGTVVRADNGALRLVTSLTNSGAILIDAAGNETRVRLQGDVTLMGGGSITLMGSNAGIDGNGILTNVNNTISGHGNLGFNSIGVVNQGVIEAGNGANLLLDPRNAGAGNVSFDNQNIVRATDGGVLTLTGSGFGEFGGSGVYLATNGSQLELVTEFIARNTTFATQGTGVIRAMSGSNQAWDSITNAGNFVRDDNGTLTLINTLTNSGTMTFNSTGNATRMRSAGNLTLNGGGSVVFTGANSGIDGNETLTNLDNTISGNGNLGVNSISIVNQGTISAGMGQSLTIDPRNAGAGNISFDNQGLVHVAGGTVVLTGNGFGEFANRSGGRIRIDSTLRLEASAIFNNQSGGRMEGNGLIVTTGSSFSNSGGVVAPGLSTGILTFEGHFTQGLNGDLEIEWGGSSPGTTHDQLVVTGSANLAGTIAIDPLAGITDPAARGTVQDFTFLIFGNRSGAFSDLLYDGTPLNPLFVGDLTVFYAGSSGTSGLPGMFRRVEYTSSEAIFSNYLALPGDANGDGFVDGTDFGIWNANKFSSGTAWTTGDFNNDGVTDGSDFGIWNANKFTSVLDQFQTRIVPEPNSILLTLGLALMAMRQRIRLSDRRRNERSTFPCPEQSA